jgi:hypothetical protein
VAVTPLDVNGYALVRGVIEPDLIARLIAASPPVERGGLRNLLREAPPFRALLDHAGLRSLIADVVGDGVVVTRAILFDKSPGANWALGWHQDTAVAVAERVETPGFGPWSVKDGVHHVRPPAAVLERMVTARIHLDDCTASNGALRVIPGSHRHGLLSDAQTTGFTGAGTDLTCEAAAGDVLLMRPLILHASGKQEHPGHRRIAHFEFAGRPLPDGLRWPSLF